MATMPPPVPMAPPAIRAQMGGPPSPIPGQGVPVTMQVAQQNPIPQMIDPLSMLEGKLRELKLWAMDFLPMAERVHPPLTSFMAPLANIGNAMEQELNKLRERTALPPGVMGAPSPELSGAEAVAPAAAGTPPGLA